MGVPPHAWGSSADEEAEMPNRVALILKERRDRIVDEWSRKVQESSPGYARVPLEEVRKNIDAFVDGMIEAAESNDYSKVFEALSNVVRSRGAAGFRLAELQKAVMLGTDICMVQLAEAYRDETTEVCMEVIRKLLAIMNWAHLTLGDAYGDVVEKQFSAGTLVALSAAQQETEEDDIVKRSLEEISRLLGFEKGAVLMRHRSSLSASLPANSSFDDEALRELGTRTTMSGTVQTLDQEGGGAGDRQPRKTRTILRSAVGIPIAARGRVLGAVVLGSEVERSLSPHELKFATAVASQVGLACENARLLKDAKRRVEKAKESHDVLFAILSQMGASVYVADMESYTLLAVNKTIEDVFGKSIVGRKCYLTLQKNQHGPCSFCTNKFLIKDGEPVGPHVWKFQNTTTGRWYQCIDRAIKWPDGRLVRMEVAFDITELEKARMDLDDTRRMLQLYNDLMVHEIVNFVGSAKGFLEIALETPPMDARKRDEMIHSSLEQIRRTDALLERVARLSRARAAGTKAMRTLDIGEQLDTAVESFSPLGERKVEVVKEYVTGKHFASLGEFSSDIFSNLLSNAVKYGGGKPVTVSVGEGVVGGKPAWKVSFSDMGKGISDQDKQLLFTRFGRLDSLGSLKGLGLGLTLVRSLTELYGGRVAVEDRVPGDHTKGAVFSVIFPKA